MLAFKFFVFVGIVGYVVNSIKMIKQDKSTKNKVSLLVAIILFLFGIYIRQSAFINLQI